MSPLSFPRKSDIFGVVGTLLAAWVLPACGGSASQNKPKVDAGTDAPTTPAVVGFQKLVLSTEFTAEGAGFGDIDGDGSMDVVAGPHWYAGPDFTSSHSIYPEVAFDPHGYSDNFFAFVRDFDADGALDVLIVGFPGQNASWYANPKSVDAPWVRHDIALAVDTESPAFTDLTGDGEPELVCAVAGELGWLEPGPDAATAWSFHPLSPPGPFAPFTHGLGVGDVDGDGRSDVLEARGTWIQPGSLTGDPVWGFAPTSFGQGGAQMFATDVDGDGDSDVVTSLAAHGFGLSWFEQTSPGAFTEHTISSPDETQPDALHEPHALALADVNGDGLADIVSGERFWGHVPGGDPDFSAPAELVWFELVRDGSGAHYERHLVDDQSGVGTDVTAGDVTGDGRTDILVSNKKGTFLFVQTP